MELEREVSEIENSIKCKATLIAAEEVKGQTLRSISQYLDRQLELHRLERNRLHAMLADQNFQASTQELRLREKLRAHQTTCETKRKLMFEAQRLKRQVAGKRE
jgi:hypothetical protein